MPMQCSGLDADRGRRGGGSEPEAVGTDSYDGQLDDFWAAVAQSRA